MALSKDVVIRMLGDSKSAEQAIKAAADAAEVSVTAYRRAEREHAKQAKAAEAAAAQQREAMASVGRAAMTAGAVIAAGLGIAAKAAIDWESAWAGVVKTIDGSPEELSALEGELRQLATTLPATHGEIAAVAEAAGQLGIARQDVVEFTKVAIAMGYSTNLAAEDAATSMARFSNIMGTSSSDADRLGSALVELGNNGASTEAEIMAMGLRIAAAGRQAGMTEGDVLGLANAMSSVGIEAEAGGTAISQVIKDMNSAVLSGGEQLERYARIAGVSASEFAKAWRDDAASALQTVVAGLQRAQAGGQDVNATLGDLGLSGIRVSDTLLRLAGDADKLGGHLATGNRAWAENNALMNEANKRYETTASQLQMARNQITDAAIDIGGTLLPVVAKGAELVADFARGFQELPDWMQSSVVIIGALAAGIGLLGGAAAIAYPKILAFRAEMQILATSGTAASTAVGRFGLFMTGPWGAAIGVATLALGGLVTWLGNSSRASESAANYQRDLASALRESGGVINENVRALAAQKAESEQVANRSLLEWAKDLGIALPRVTDALLGQRDAYEEIVGAAQKRLDQIEAEMNTGLDGDSDRFYQLDREKRELQQVIGAYEDLANGMGGAVAENERMAAAAALTGDAAIKSGDALSGAADAAGELGGATSDAASAAEDLADALDALNGPTLDLRDATRKYEASIDAITKAMGEEGWKRTLDATTEAGRQNQEMLDDLAKAAMDQANAILANGGSYDSFRSSLEAGRGQLVQAALAMGATEEQAWALANSILQIPDAATVDIQLPTYQQTMQRLAEVQAKVLGLPPGHTVNVGVLSEQAMQKLRDLGFTVNTLPDGTVEVRANTQEAYDGLNAFLRAPAVKTVRIITDDSGATVGRDFANGSKARASGGPVWPGQRFLVGEKGPELVTFGQSGYVTPADQTAQILAALRQPAPSAAQLAFAAPAAPAVSNSSTSYSRTYAPNVVVRTARPMDERRLVALLADEEFLHG
ncbi:phage tail tape measure protein [Blastococcus sp. CCUG 61487]|uniref:phage tail tape measure protein n=1 Tax=Blastococcus sp. CCUG 61487 TaxID=1840703 RepID=UPI0010C01267|nr:phage tail tape measure protein [Blastococcus sp. CCUG 61487]TKJ24368.1 hypothetical protein A6V29_05055 [Blastococcus sp. CCUG 61487]